MIRIRKVRKTDIFPLSAVYVSAFGNIQTQEHWTQEAAKKLIATYFRRQPDLFFVATLDGNLVGAIAGLVKPWWNGNHITDGELFVHPLFQRRGIATQLLKTFTKEVIVHHNVKVIEWVTFSDTEFPLNWYKKLGFTPVRNWVVISVSPQTILNNLP